MKTRILVAIPIAVILIAALVLQSWVLIGLILVMSLIAQHEILKALESKGTALIKSIPFIFTGASFFILFFSGLGMLFIVFLFCVVSMFVVAMFKQKYNFESLLYSIFAMVYPQLLFVFAYLITIQFTNMQFFGTNPVVLVLAIIPPIFSDIFAYFFGRAFGKKKLCESISPKKTIVGAVAGLIGGAVAALLIWLFMASGRITILFWDMNAIHFIVLGVLVAAVSQIGDLSASFVKRHFGIKDYGTLLPGHGGILDRVDSILFALPIVYLYFIVYNSNLLVNLL